MPRKLEELDDQLAPELIAAFVGPFMFASLLLVQQRHSQFAMGPMGLTFNAIVGIIGFGVVCRRVARLRKQRVRLRLGFSGERAVGEELNLLMRNGAHVFHDLPTPPYGNIDHVLVAPTGVYAIETKTRRKREQVPGGAATHKVTYDGCSLRFAGDSPRTRELDQARQQASRLGGMNSPKPLENPSRCTPSWPCQAGSWSA